MVSNQAYYDAFSKQYDADRGSGYHRLIDEQATELVRRVGEGGRVLEVGCGTGLILGRVGRFAERAAGWGVTMRIPWVRTSRVSWGSTAATSAAVSKRVSIACSS